MPLSCPLPRRLRRLSLLRRALLLLGLALVFDSLFILAMRRPPAISGPRSRPARGLSAVVPSAPALYRTVFIAAVHTDTAPLLHRSWSDSLVSLVDRLGPGNVHVSLVETASHDATRPELRQLMDRLDRHSVPNTLYLGTAGWQLARQAGDKPVAGEHRAGWVWHHNDTKVDMRAVPHLAWARNKAMEPLMALAAEGKLFDRVLWIEDVGFQAQDAMDILNTRDGEYAAACSIDINRSARLHDTSALRDDRGRPPLSSFYPWFLSRTARRSVTSGAPVRVYSCWNGLVALQSAPFYADPPLRFRSLSDGLAGRRIEASERCLFHADNPLSPSQGVWLNPAVRVVPGRPSRAASSVRRYPSGTDVLLGSWVNRLVRWWGRPQRMIDSDNRVRAVFQEWLTETHAVDLDESETGLPCLVDDVQVVGPDGSIHA